MSLDRVLADGYVGDVTALSMDDLRTKRAECQGLEVGLSYQRRMAQGRLDIVAAERRRRADGGPAPSHDDFIRTLAATLADRSRPPGHGRLPQLMAPDDADLVDLVERLSTYEGDVSKKRRALHERIDALQGEITRRYRTGEATVESLLQ